MADPGKKAPPKNPLVVQMEQAMKNAFDNSAKAAQAKEEAVKQGNLFLAMTKHLIELDFRTSAMFLFNIGEAIALGDKIKALESGKSAPENVKEEFAEHGYRLKEIGEEIVGIHADNQRLGAVLGDIIARNVVKGPEEKGPDP